MSKVEKNTKKRKIPTVSEERLDKSPCDTSIGDTKEDKRASAFIKGKIPLQPLTLRLPLPLYEVLRKIAFKENSKMTHIILKSIKEHLESEYGVSYKNDI